METLYFDVLQFLYHLALALIVGGAIVLGSAVAPAVFKAARTPGKGGEGGLLFGAILARFDQLAILAVFIASYVPARRAAELAPVATIRGSR